MVVTLSHCSTHNDMDDPMGQIMGAHGYCTQVRKMLIHGGLIPKLADAGHHILPRYIFFPCKFPAAVGGVCRLFLYMDAPFNGLLVQCMSLRNDFI